MERCLPANHCANHEEDQWMYCVMCRTRVQSANALRRAQARTVSWPDKRTNDLTQPIRDTSSCTINEALDNIVRCLNTTTRSCKKYYNGQPENKKNVYDKGHCRRFHVDREKTTATLTNSPLMSQGLDSMSIVLDPGTYSITAGEWGGQHTQTHVVKLSPGQSANLDFVF